MKRGALLVFGGTAKTFDGLQAVVCGSASPLGNNLIARKPALPSSHPSTLVDVGARAPMLLTKPAALEPFDGGDADALSFGPIAPQM